MPSICCNRSEDAVGNCKKTQRGCQNVEPGPSKRDFAICLTQMCLDFEQDLFCMRRIGF